MHTKRQGFSLLRRINRQSRYAATRDGDPVRHTRRHQELSRCAENRQMMRMVPRYRDTFDRNGNIIASVYLGHFFPSPVVYRKAA